MTISQFIPDFVFGGFDGIITTFAIVAGAIGAHLDLKVIITLGLAKLLADGFSIASARYLSAKAEEEKSETSRKPSPFSSAITIYLSFIVMGMIPLITFIYGYFLQRSGDKMYIEAYILTAVGLFAVGYVKGQTLNSDPLSSGLRTLIIGGIAAFIAYITAKELIQK